jgi:hypothetical protein
MLKYGSQATSGTAGGRTAGASAATALAAAINTTAMKSPVMPPHIFDLRIMRAQVDRLFFAPSAGIPISIVIVCFSKKLFIILRI